MKKAYGLEAAPPRREQVKQPVLAARKNAPILKSASRSATCVKGTRSPGSGGERTVHEMARCQLPEFSH